MIARISSIWGYEGQAFRLSIVAYAGKLEDLGRQYSSSTAVWEAELKLPDAKRPLLRYDARDRPSPRSP